MVTAIKIRLLKIKIFLILFYRFFKASIGKIVYWFKVKKEGYEVITARRMLTEFPGKSSCKKCSYGHGFIVRQLPDKTQTIGFCDCVMRQYVRSGKKYIVKDIE